MFKNFQIGGNPGIDGYLNSKGVVPVQQPVMGQDVAQQPQIVAQQPQMGGGVPQAAPRQQPAANNFVSLTKIN